MWLCIYRICVQFVIKIYLHLGSSHDDLWSDMVCHTLCLVDIYEPWFKSNISRSYGMVLPFIDCIHPSSLGIKMVFELRSRGSTRRHLLRPKGWKQFPSTKEGNRLARRLCYLSRPQIVEYLSLLRISFF